MVANGLGGFHEKPLEQYAEKLGSQSPAFHRKSYSSETTACVDAHAGRERGVDGGTRPRRSPIPRRRPILREKFRLWDSFNAHAKIMSNAICTHGRNDMTQGDHF
jgi:hypothetical protein